MVARDPLESPFPDEAEAPADDTPPEGRAAAEAPTIVDDHPATQGHAAATCPVTWCPICVTVGAVQPLAPDVVEHLLKAGTELFMAFRAIVDARADEASGAPADAPRRTTLEKIDLG